MGAQVKYLLKGVLLPLLALIVQSGQNLYVGTILMSNFENFSNTNQSPITLTGASIDVTLSMTLDDITRARKFLQSRMEAPDTEQYTNWHRDGRTEEELHLLMATLSVTANHLRCSNFDFIFWLEWRGADQEISDYSKWKVSRMSDEDIASALYDRDVEAISAIVLGWKHQHAMARKQIADHLAKRRADSRARKAARLLKKAA